MQPPTDDQTGGGEGYEGGDSRGARRLAGEAGGDKQISTNTLYGKEERVCLHPLRRRLGSVNACSSRWLTQRGGDLSSFRQALWSLYSVCRIMIIHFLVHVPTSEKEEGFHLLEISVKHLDDGVLTVDVSLVILRQDLDVLPKAFHLLRIRRRAENGGDVVPGNRVISFAE